MAGIKFCRCLFEDQQKFVALYECDGDSKEAIINEFKISLSPSEDIVILDSETEAEIDSKQLYALVSTLQKPTDLKFKIQSMFCIKILLI